jgi:hypothetical protein
MGKNTENLRCFLGIAKQICYSPRQRLGVIFPKKRGIMASQLSQQPTKQ